MRKWQIQKTLLIVGEGNSEVAFLKHIKNIFCARGNGQQITIKNAHGKGAQHVIEWTIRQINIANYDQTAVLLYPSHFKMRDFKVQIGLKLLRSD